MPEPYWADESVTLYHGDCLSILPTLADCSVDAIVTDPPAGIAFMGREWDHHKGGRDQWIAWLSAVMAEALRVAKPGAHALVWGLPRTSHWTATAIEDAGWEIRDCITHLFGSGFPKSLDVSKAIDKARNDRPDVLAVTSRLGDLATAAGITRAAVDAYMGTTDMGAWWLSSLPQRCACPSVENWTRLRDLIPGATELDAEVWRLNGRKGSPGEAWEQREVVGAASVPNGYAFAGPTYGGDSSGRVVDLTAPATAAARTWQGWGTALKPASEHWWLARKPFRGTVAGNVLAHGTGALNVDACRVPHVTVGSGNLAVNPHLRATIKHGGQINPSSIVRPEHEAPADPAGRWPPNVLLDQWEEPLVCLRDSLDPQTERTIREYFGASSDHLPPVRDAIRDLPVEGESPAVLLQGVLRGVDDDTDRREGDQVRQGPHDGVAPQDERDKAGSGSSGAGFAELAGRSVRDGRVRDGQHREPPGGGSSTLAADGADGFGEGGHPRPVHPGAPAVDGAASGSGAEIRRAGPSRERDQDGQPDREPRAAHGGVAHAGARPDRAGDQAPAGREPTTPRRALEVLRCDVPAGWAHHFRLTGRTVTGGSAAELDRQSGTLTTQRTRNTPDVKYGEDHIFAFGNQRHGPTYFGDTGGASRFFPTFRYEAKAPTSERPGKPGEVRHPTVKPLDLMRWLVRLVTPPGGLVLDPFAGSGTTGEACVLEHMRALLIEREADYLPLIVGRLSKPLAVGFDFEDGAA